MANLPLLLDWKALKQLGHPWSRQHTFREMHAGRFPKVRKLGEHRGSRAVWLTSEVIDWYKGKGLQLDVTITAP